MAGVALSAADAISDAVGALVSTATSSLLSSKKPLKRKSQAEGDDRGAKIRHVDPGYDSDLDDIVVIDDDNERTGAFYGREFPPMLDTDESYHLWTAEFLHPVSHVRVPVVRVEHLPLPARIDSAESAYAVISSWMKERLVEAGCCTVQELRGDNPLGDSHTLASTGDYEDATTRGVRKELKKVEQAVVHNLTTTAMDLDDTAQGLTAEGPELKFEDVVDITPPPEREVHLQQNPVTGAVIVPPLNGDILSVADSLLVRADEATSQGKLIDAEKLAASANEAMATALDQRAATLQHMRTQQGIRFRDLMNAKHVVTEDTPSSPMDVTDDELKVDKSDKVDLQAQRALYTDLLAKESTTRALSAYFRRNIPAHLRDQAQAMLADPVQRDRYKTSSEQRKRANDLLRKAEKQHALSIDVSAALKVPRNPMVDMAYPFYVVRETVTSKSVSQDMQSDSLGVRWNCNNWQSYCSIDTMLGELHAACEGTIMSRAVVSVMRWSYRDITSLYATEHTDYPYSDLLRKQDKKLANTVVDTPELEKKQMDAYIRLAIDNDKGMQMKPLQSAFVDALMENVSSTAEYEPQLLQRRLALKLSKAGQNPQAFDITIFRCACCGTVVWGFQDDLLVDGGGCAPLCGWTVCQMLGPDSLDLNREKLGSANFPTVPLGKLASDRGIIMLPGSMDATADNILRMFERTLVIPDDTTLIDVIHQLYRTDEAGYHYFCAGRTGVASSSLNMAEAEMSQWVTANTITKLDPSHLEPLMKKAVLRSVRRLKNGLSQRVYHHLITGLVSGILRHAHAKLEPQMKPMLERFLGPRIVPSSSDVPILRAVDWGQVCEAAYRMLNSLISKSRDFSDKIKAAGEEVMRNPVSIKDVAKDMKNLGLALASQSPELIDSLTSTMLESARTLLAVPRSILQRRAAGSGVSEDTSERKALDVMHEHEIKERYNLRTRVLMRMMGRQVDDPDTDAFGIAHTVAGARRYRTLATARDQSLMHNPRARLRFVLQNSVLPLTDHHYEFLLGGVNPVLDPVEFMEMRREEMRRMLRISYLPKALAWHAQASHLPGIRAGELAPGLEHTHDDSDSSSDEEDGDSDSDDEKDIEVHGTFKNRVGRHKMEVVAGELQGMLMPVWVTQADVNKLYYNLFIDLDHDVKDEEALDPALSRFVDTARLSEAEQGMAKKFWAFPTMGERRSVRKSHDLMAPYSKLTFPMHGDIRHVLPASEKLTAQQALQQYTDAWEAYKPESKGPPPALLDVYAQAIARTTCYTISTRLEALIAHRSEWEKKVARALANSTIKWNPRHVELLRISMDLPKLIHSFESASSDLMTSEVDLVNTVQALNTNIAKLRGLRNELELKQRDISGVTSGKSSEKLKFAERKVKAGVLRSQASTLEKTLVEQRAVVTHLASSFLRQHRAVIVRKLGLMAEAEAFITQHYLTTDQAAGLMQQVVALAVNCQPLVDLHAQGIQEEQCLRDLIPFSLLNGDVGALAVLRRLQGQVIAVHSYNAVRSVAVKPDSTEAELINRRDAAVSSGAIFHWDFLPKDIKLWLKNEARQAGLHMQQSLRVIRAYYAWNKKMQRLQEYVKERASLSNMLDYVDNFRARFNWSTYILVAQSEEVGRKLARHREVKGDLHVPDASHPDWEPRLWQKAVRLMREMQDAAPITTLDTAEDVDALMGKPSITALRPAPPTVVTQTSPTDIVARMQRLHIVHKNETGVHQAQTVTGETKDTLAAHDEPATKKRKTTPSVPYDAHSYLATVDLSVATSQAPMQKATDAMDEAASRFVLNSVDSLHDMYVLASLLDAKSGGTGAWRYLLGPSSAGEIVSDAPTKYGDQLRQETHGLARGLHLHALNSILDNANSNETTVDEAVRQWSYILHQVTGNPQELSLDYKGTNINRAFKNFRMQVVKQILQHKQHMAFSELVSLRLSALLRAWEHDRIEVIGEAEFVKRSIPRNIVKSLISLAPVVQYARALRTLPSRDDITAQEIRKLSPMQLVRLLMSEHGGDSTENADEKGHRHKVWGADDFPYTDRYIRLCLKPTMWFATTISDAWHTGVTKAASESEAWYFTEVKRSGGPTPGMELVARKMMQAFQEDVTKTTGVMLTTIDLEVLGMQLAAHQAKEDTGIGSTTKTNKQKMELIQELIKSMFHAATREAYDEVAEFYIRDGTMYTTDLAWKDAHRRMQQKFSEAIRSRLIQLKRATHTGLAYEESRAVSSSSSKPEVIDISDSETDADADNQPLFSKPLKPAPTPAKTQGPYQAPDAEQFLMAHFANLV